VVVLGAQELDGSLDRHLALRAALPSVLGLRDLDSLISSEVRARSSLDIQRAQALARVFVVTRAYERARVVLGRHRFVVLTGPPEMGKTAIAQMVALAQLTGGWEAHECISPQQVWKAFDPERAQVFVADDAFGSTEYRPDAAERWARELGRLLGALDDRHWLIWTSRPAPLRAGLRRVQRERGSERFPAPGEVLVDASELDLAERTLILFRHAKGRAPSEAARDVVRATGLAIVEHPHFTPERIRRFVGDRLDDLVGAAQRRGRREREREVLEAVERELAMPTEAMANSYAALEEQHRALLTALLDTPAGLTNERELTAAVRRHEPAGLSQPTHQLIDRLSDHFLRISPLGIDWVHPSWRDLVIEQLQADQDDRRGFLRACGAHGAMLVLSRAGGIGGERVLPLLRQDGDWDAFSERLGELLKELDYHDIARLLLALGDLADELDGTSQAEAQDLAGYVLGATRRRWDKQPQPLPVFVLEAWYHANGKLRQSQQPPQIGPTWIDLHPDAAPGGTRAELQRAEDWLALAQTLRNYDPAVLETVGFPERDSATLLALGQAIQNLNVTAQHELRPVIDRLLARLHALAPAHAVWETLPYWLDTPAVQERWWTPHDIDTPPTTDPVAPTPATLAQHEVDRVLQDL
jgi:hypothetical protein